MCVTESLIRSFRNAASARGLISRPSVSRRTSSTSSLIHLSPPYPAYSLEVMHCFGMGIGRRHEYWSNTQHSQHQHLADGSHNVRSGADFRFYRSFGNRFPTDIAPDFNFSTSEVSFAGPLDNSAASPIGQDLAAFLVGIPAGTMSRSCEFRSAGQFLGIFIQDDFKLSSKLTVNVGLRYELETPITERYDRLVAGFAFGQFNPLEPAAKAGVRAQSDSERPPPSSASTEDSSSSTRTGMAAVLSVARRTTFFRA